MNLELSSLPDDKISDWSKLKAYADDKINMTEKLKFVLKRVENIVVTSIFCFFPQFFQRLPLKGHLKTRWCSKGLTGPEYNALL